MKRLVFGEGLMLQSLDGSKRFTVRVYREGSHDFTKGEIIKGEFKDGLTILLQIVADTKKAPFIELKCSKNDLDKNGYYFDTRYFKELGTHYTDMTWDTMGAIVFFEVLRVGGIPVVTPNEHRR